MDKPILSFPTFIAGKNSGLILCSDGCRCATALIHDAEQAGTRFTTIEGAAAAWARQCEKYFEAQLNETGDGGSDPSLCK